MTIRIEDMVQREVMCCMSSLVSTLAQGYVCPQVGPGTRHIVEPMEALRSLYDQACDLSLPIPDYEEAAIQAGGEMNQEGEWFVTGEDTTLGTAQEYCETFNLDPYDREVYEHWAVSQWLAEKLIEQGERVDTDFAGLNVWARTTTGQAISSDGVIERIYAAMMVPA